MIYRLYTVTKMSRNLTLRLTNLEHADSSLSGFYLIWVWYENCLKIANCCFTPHSWWSARAIWQKPQRTLSWLASVTH